MPAPSSEAARAYRSADLPRRRTPWREVAFTVIDFETTGLDPVNDEIVSFATVTVAGGRVRVDDAHYELVRPQRMPDADTIRIHGLRETDLVAAPTLAEQINGLLEAITGRALVAHVAPVERGFLAAILSSLGLELRNRIIDTAALNHELRRLRRDPPAPNPIGLTDLSRSLGLPVHRPHHADGDALTTAQAFIALAAHLDAISPQTLGTLERISRSEAKLPWFRGVIGRFGSRHDRT
jgi:DNA polymerase III subunit epsilon